MSRRGRHLREAGAENYHIREHSGIIVKDCFWREQDFERAGNPIDFFSHVLGMSLHTPSGEHVTLIDKHPAPYRQTLRPLPKLGVSAE